jgi:hypothetical protein
MEKGGCAATLGRAICATNRGNSGKFVFQNRLRARFLSARNEKNHLAFFSRQGFWFKCFFDRIHMICRFFKNHVNPVNPVEKKKQNQACHRRAQEKIKFR